MRIIAGTLRGRVLKSTKAAQLRPTTDRVREAIFNMLAARIDMEDLRVLDLFAGTGALGIEALSRGAGRCDFVERDRRCVEVVRENLAALGLGDCAEVHARDVMTYLEHSTTTYDLVLADPPYAATSFDRLVGAVFAPGRLSAGGMFLLEHGSAMRIVPPQSAVVETTRLFGDSAITLLAPRAPEPAAGGADRDHR